MYSALMSNRIEGKTVLITGGTTGIGRATAVLLAKKGASVLIFGRHERELEDALSDIKKISGRESLGMIADVTDHSTVERVFQKIDRDFGHLDVLVNNASLPARSVLYTDYDQIDSVIKANLIGYLYCTKLACDRMLRARSGHIVSMGSMSAFTRDEETDLYVATKCGVEGFNESIRKMIGPNGIKMTIIEPGTVGTNMVDESSEEQRKAEEGGIFLKAEDIAEAIFYALSQPERVNVLRVQLKPRYQIF